MEFVVGDYLEIEVLEGFYRGEYTSRITSVSNDNLVVVTPKMGGIFLPFKEGQVLKVSIPKDDARYDCDATVISLKGTEDALLTLALFQTVKRQQRRLDVRLNIKIPVELLYFYREDTPVASLTVNSIDISAGGIKLEMPEQYPPHTKFKLAIHLLDEDVFTYAVVVRTGVIQKTEPGITGTYWVSLKFFNISESKQSKILKFIYRQQELRVKGLI
jgi:c-di-GMP-binding flagellar brake protein YcgR